MWLTGFEVLVPPILIRLRNAAGDNLPPVWTFAMPCMLRAAPAIIGAAPEVSEKSAYESVYPGTLTLEVRMFWPQE